MLPTIQIDDAPPTSRSEFRPATRDAHHNRVSRLSYANRQSHVSPPYSVDDDDDNDEYDSLGDRETLTGSPKKKVSHATYLGTSSMLQPPDKVTSPRDPYAHLETSTLASFNPDVMVEEPSMKKFIRKVKMANTASASLLKLRAKTIEKHRLTYAKACRILKIPELRHFVRQIGDRQIDMGRQFLSWKELNAVISALMTDTYSTSLNLASNNMDIISVGYVDKLLKNNAHLTSLDLSDNHFHKSGLSRLTGAVCKSKHLTRLSLSGNQLTDNHASPIAELIQVSHKLLHLDLSHNQFREKGGILIGDALGKNDDLQSLNLSWNHLRGKGAECIAMGLMKNTNLVSLNVAWNGFGYEGCTAMGHALKSNTTLEELDISCNRIHPPALFEFLKGLMGNKALLKLRMGDNPITAVATTPLMCCIRDNAHMPLQEIDLTGVVVDREFEFVLSEIREERVNFRAVYDLVLPVHKEKWEHATKRQAGDVIFNCDPVKILYYTQKNLRVIDLFRTMDRDGSNRLDRDEIREGLKRADFHLSSSALDAIFDYLDENNDGEIDLKEFLAGSRMFKRQELADQQQQAERPKVAVEEAMNGVGADQGGVQGRFSSTYRPNLKIPGEFLPEINAETARKTKQKVGDNMSSAMSDTGSVKAADKAKTDARLFTRLS